MSQNDLEELGTNFSFEVVGGSTDFTAPVLTQLSADKSVVDVTNGPQVINFDLDL